MPDRPDPSDTASIREVYQLVGDVREDIGGRIDRLGDRIASTVAGHADRITAIETIQSGGMRTLLDHEAQLKTHEQRIVGLETERTARQRLVTVAQWAAGITAALSGGLVTDMLVRVVH